MKLLNTKSIRQCNELEELTHNEENNKIIQHIISVKNYDCAVLKKYQDVANKSKEMEVLPSNLQSLDEVIMSCDCKNGMDIYLDEENYYVFVLYGQIYILNGIPGMVTTALKIMPYDDNRNFIDITNIN